MKKIFITSYGGGHANIIKSVYAELMDKYSDKIEVTYLALTMAPQLLDRYNIPYDTVSDVVCKLPFGEQIMKLGEQYGSSYHTEDSGIKKDDTLAYYGMGLYDLVERFGKEKALKLFDEKGRKAFLPITVMKKVLELYKPDVVVVTTSPRTEEACGIAANELGIPVVQITDFPVLDRKFLFEAKICVMNQWSKDNLIEQLGINSEDIVITGQPVFEDDLIEDEEEQNRIRTKYKMTEYSKCLVFFAQPGRNQMEVFKIIHSIASRMKDCLFIIKLHPNQIVDNISEIESDNVAFAKERAKEFLQMCDIVITENSTTGVEGLILGKPLIEERIIPYDTYFHYADVGMGIACYTEQEMYKCIAELLDEKTVLYKERINYKTRFEYVAGASEKIAQLIMSV